MKIPDDAPIKEFPSQTENRKQWIIDAIRTNQGKVFLILKALYGNNWFTARNVLDSMQKMDRDAILQPGGILTNEQLGMLKVLNEQEAE